MDLPSPVESSLDQADFSSSHTESLPALLRQLNISLLVSTYQAGKLIMLRAEGERLNTHFRTLRSPMGLAYEHATGRLAVGARNELWQFQNHPHVSSQLDP